MKINKKYLILPIIAALLQFTSCDKDSDTDLTIDSNGFLTNKITKITWKGVFSSGTETETYKLSYNTDNQIVEGFGSYKYSNDSIYVYDMDNESDGIFVINNNRAQSFIRSNKKQIVYNYQNGFLTSFSSNASNYSFSIQDKTLQKYTVEDSDIKTEYIFEYNGQKNNLNVDLLPLCGIFEFHYEYAAYLGIAGNRFEFLPSKITETTSFDNQKTTSTISFDYKTSGQYISEITITIDGEGGSYKEIYSIEY